MHSVTEFRDFGTQLDLPRVRQGPDGTWRPEPALSGGAHSWLAPLLPLAPLAPGALLLALVGALAVLVLRHRHRKLVYAAVSVVTCLSLVAGPLIQAAGAAAAVQRVARKMEA